MRDRRQFLVVVFAIFFPFLVIDLSGRAEGQASFIERLFAPGDTPTTKYMRITGGVNRTGGTAIARTLDEGGRALVDAPSSISTGNTTNVALGSNATYTGTWEYVTDFEEIDLNLAGSAGSAAPGTFFFEFSVDNGSHVDVSVPLSVNDINAGIVPNFLRVVLPYFRVRYVNGAVAQTSFRLTVLFHRGTACRLTRFLNQTIGNTEPVENVRAVSMAQQPGTPTPTAQPSGAFINVPATGVDPNNSTTATLGANGIFTGSITSCGLWASLSITAIANQNSAAMGISVKWYNDAAGTQLVRTSQFTYDQAPNGVAISDFIEAPYYQLIYTNGANAQASFVLITQLKTVPASGNLQPVSNAVNGGLLASLTKSVLIGLQPNGTTFGDVGLTSNNYLQTAVVDAAQTDVSGTFTATGMTPLGSTVTVAPNATGFLTNNNGSGPNAFIPIYGRYFRLIVTTASIVAAVTDVKWHGKE